LHQPWFETLFEVINCSMVIKLYFGCSGKSFELRYEDVESIWSMFELDKAIECLLLPVGIGEGVLECLFKLRPVDFFGVRCSSCNASLELGHLLFFPRLHHVSLYVGERGGDTRGWVAHGLVLSIGESKDAKCN